MGNQISKKYMQPKASEKAMGSWYHLKIRKHLHVSSISDDHRLPGSTTSEQCINKIWEHC